MRIVLFLLLVSVLHAQPKLIAHRGASDKAPENTLAAFQLAWKEGADGIEADFRLTKDQRIVCIHDEDTRRTSNKTLKIAESHWEELRTLDVGSWKGRKYSKERLPLLEEVLVTIPPGKFFFLEIKSGPEIVAPLSKLLRAADTDHTILISFDPEVVLACRHKLPKLQTHLVSSLDQLPKEGAEDTYLKILNALEVNGLQFRHDARVTADFLRQARGTDRLLACWTVDSPRTARRIAKLGVDFITTNRPGALRRKTHWPEPAGR